MLVHHEDAKAIAHIGTDRNRVHNLVDHLLGTAEKAYLFGETFDSSAITRLAGLWHDLGKFSEAFQELIRSAQQETVDGPKPKAKVDHSSAGALLANEVFKGNVGWGLAFAIAGHHAGLADKQNLKERLETKKFLLKEIMESSLNEIPSPAPESVSELPFFLRSLSDPVRFRRSYEFWVRMLFSALVDADFLDAEQFFDVEDKRVQHRSTGEPVDALLKRFNLYMIEKARSSSKTLINEVRNEILSECLHAATGPQGIYSLTAPTGSGKTLATMGFALEHASHHRLKRIIVVLPYTTIIEQNAKIYKEVFGEENVIEHHATLDPEEETFRNELACENWDAPVIVTTSVQFFESLFSNRSSGCRKLHNIARSVVIFDEVQTFPVHHLAPILDSLNEITENYGVSLLLSTATQPALKERRNFSGLKSITEILSSPSKYFELLKRIEVIWPEDLYKPVTWEDLAEQIKKHDRVLVIVHKRTDAKILTELLPSDAFHLSTFMCPKHRLRALDEIKYRLESKAPVKVVSTQLVEAGVDLDFPVVFRALGGIEAVAQAAGRCNREGKLTSLGQVCVFVAPTEPPRGVLRTGLERTRALLKSKPNIDLSDPSIFEQYFRELYFSHDHDRDGILREREALHFKTVAQTFRMIDEAGKKAIVVPYDDAEKRLTKFEFQGPSRKAFRSLQPYIVEIYEPEMKKLEARGALQLVSESVWTLASGFRHLYTDRFGLLVNEAFYQSPESLIV